MVLEFGYGKGVQKVNIPDKNLIGILTANNIGHERTGESAVHYAIENPIGAPKLHEIVKPDKKIVIIVSDISRPVPSHQILPPLLNQLLHAGCKEENITIVFALGSHRHHTDEEKKMLVGDFIYSRIKCVDSDPSDCLHMGTTHFGTPVDITRIVAEADFRIATGNIEFHYFAGYSGGAKALLPGVSTPEAIQHNHRMMVSENAHAGKIEGNPIRIDIEEAEKFCPLDYIINVVLDEHKNIVFAVAGDVLHAHREGCAYLNRMYLKELDAKADIVIVSQGGAPKDVNLYQAQKALDNAKHAVKDGGTIILIGACNEGLGNKKFEEWLTCADTSHSLVERIKSDFQLGGHKAAAISMVLDHVQIDLVSEMNEDFVQSIFLNPKQSAQVALDEALEKYGKNATVLAMPFGGATLPTIK